MKYSIFLVLFIFIFFGSRNTKVSNSQNKKEYNDVNCIINMDSIFINIIMDYNDSVFKQNSNGLIVIKIRSFSNKQVDFTIGYILNDIYLSKYRPTHYFYLNVIPIIVKVNELSIINEYKGSIRFKAIDKDFILECKNKLGSYENGYYTYNPSYWLVMIEKNKINIIKNITVPPPGYSIYE